MDKKLLEGSGMVASDTGSEVKSFVQHNMQDLKIFESNNIFKQSQPSSIGFSKQNPKQSTGVSDTHHFSKGFIDRIENDCSMGSAYGMSTRQVIQQTGQILKKIKERIDARRQEFEPEKKDSVVGKLKGALNKLKKIQERADKW